VLYNNDSNELNDLILSINNLSKEIEKGDGKLIFYIYDNSPIDTLKDYLYNNIKKEIETKYYHDKRNKGFGYGHNRNLLDFKNNENDIYIVINPDISFESKSLLRLIKSFQRKKNLSCVAPLIKNTKGSIQYSAKNNPTISSLALGRLGTFNIGFLEKYIEKNQNKKYDYEKDIINCCYLSGCFLIIKAQAYTKINGFCEKYFLHMEDADIVRRLSYIGETIHNPKAVVIHKWSRGSHKSLKQMLSLIKSMIIYFNIWGWKLF
tara:strand:- start:1514 stop:2302 length:789 start_codon:yes stop_codon:yes gene_type:complete